MTSTTLEIDASADVARAAIGACPFLARTSRFVQVLPARGERRGCLIRVVWAGAGRRVRRRALDLLALELGERAALIVSSANV